MNSFVAKINDAPTFPVMFRKGIALPCRRKRKWTDNQKKAGSRTILRLLLGQLLWAKPPNQHSHLAVSLLIDAGVQNAFDRTDDVFPHSSES